MTQRLLDAGGDASNISRLSSVYLALILLVPAVLSFHDRAVGATPGWLKEFAQAHCLACHDKSTSKGGLALDELLVGEIPQHAQAWEKVVRKLAARQMPPPEAARPTELEYDAALAGLTTALDAAAAQAPRPGRTETFRRLTRTEYQHTIRDLLALDVDVTSLLPADESSHGFDNITVADLSPALLNRYLAAAQKISRLALGHISDPQAETIRIRPDLTQDVPIEGLPLGTRGGALIPHNFPQDGEYEIQVHLMRDRNEDIEGLNGRHELEFLLDRQRFERFTIERSQNAHDRQVDANLKSRVKVTAGPHQLGVTFVKQPSSLLETPRQPLNVHFNYYRHPRLGPAIYEISIVGPFEATGPGDTPSRRQILTSQPKGAEDEEACARQILSTLLRRAYRRAVDDDDLRGPLAAYHQGHADDGFEAGLESALAAILVNPQFLFRIERDPPKVAAGAVYRIAGSELASRLSYFLWSSMPDDELLRLGASGELFQPEVLEQQVRRMLADEKSSSLVTNFAAQWLYLRNLDSVTPDMRLYPDWDDNLRQALRRETELLFASILREDRSVLDLLKSERTFLNERIARHYGIPHVYGGRFRPVAVDQDAHRGGLLRQGSVLTVTSYATRTSPVLRGHWVLQNLLGSPPPPPPPNVPALEDNIVSSTLSMRERLQQHRANPACAGCHQQMDPIGFALENFDAVGRWRTTDAGQTIDAAGGLWAEGEFNGVAGLEQALLARPEPFVQTLTEKLLTFALGRGLETYDAPAVRQVVRQAQAADDRFSQIVLGIVQCTPFQMRTAP